MNTATDDHVHYSANTLMNVYKGMNFSNKRMVDRDILKKKVEIKKIEILEKIYFDLCFDLESLNSQAGFSNDFISISTFHKVD